MAIPNKVSAQSVLTHPHPFVGELTASSLPRLAQALQGGQGRVHADLLTDRNSGYARLYGRLEGELQLICQRCTKPYEWSLDAPVDLRLVFSEQEEKDALSGSDPYLVENDELPLKELVEEEVLLALPMLPRCETCENAGSSAAPYRSAKQKKVETRRDNPFAALKDQLKK